MIDIVPKPCSGGEVALAILSRNSGGRFISTSFFSV
jgi:hypothetical protein